ncbi:MAG: ABC transporter permease [Acidobacteria bacterium]|nr:ABC transporter permease [Acidobacteriota bacterium]
MAWIGRIRSRLAVLFHPGRFDRELEEEMQSHLEMQVEENLETGMDAEEARYAARRRFGNAPLLREASREIWGWISLERLFQDVRYALRFMRRSPGFTTVAMLTLALGIGANTAIFSLLDTILLRALPVRNPGGLVFVQKADRRESVSRFSYPVFRELRDKCGSFSGLFAFTPVNGVTVRSSGSGGSTAEEVAMGQLVSGEFFDVLGVSALMGRVLRPEDDRVQGGHPVAVISYGYWKRRWAQDPSVLGRTLAVDGVDFTIVGVAPPEFFGVV